MENQGLSALPGWVPECAGYYLAHTEAGQTIRKLAKARSCHASTILRQIRKVERLRDDPLVDAALSLLAREHFAMRGQTSLKTKELVETKEEYRSMTRTQINPEQAPDENTLESEALRILRRLCETGAVLAVAENMDKAVVVRDGEGSATTRTAVVECSIAQAMALKNWISCDKPGRISRYRITSSGRTELGKLIARQENQARKDREHGFAEGQTPFIISGGAQNNAVSGAASAESRRSRYTLSESPLAALARRKDRDGQPFLDPSLVRTGERLREDFELAQMGSRVAHDWSCFLTGGGRGGMRADIGVVGQGPSAARDRVSSALSDLGPGLSDVVLRCCCYLEGLETAERNMGWSARSGKIVLRIALQRLKFHYESLNEPERMIG